MVQTVCVVTPIYNDWDSLTQLIANLSSIFSGKGIILDVLAINDGSTAASSDIFLPQDGSVRSIRIADLRTNAGHQMAIAAGLFYLGTLAQPYDAVLIMDADGEDRPEDALKLIEAGRRNADAIIVAERTKRSESAAFKMLYSFYRAVFRSLTGKHIKFGNFMLIPGGDLPELLSRPELPYHVAAAVLRSRLPLISVGTTRGIRYAGKSQMNLPALVFHAAAALSVFSDVLFARLLIAASGVVCIASLGILLVIIMRLFTTLTTPGWATLVVGILGVVALQILILIFFMGFLLITNRVLMLSASSQAGNFINRIRNHATRDGEAITKITVP